MNLTMKRYAKYGAINKLDLKITRLVNGKIGRSADPKASWAIPILPR